MSAWLPVEGYPNIKACPACGGSALEGEVDCIVCGFAPDDDTSWRELGHVFRIIDTLDHAPASRAPETETTL
ncbi:MAG TPA: hypothetical protein VKD22_10485 [Ramlibacter sp.]|nr:hypothetical protein [Ramlibacter sp.]